MDVYLSGYNVISVNEEPASREIIDYGVKMVGAPLEWPETMGDGIKVGIIDTGICSSHPDLRGRIRDGACFVDGIESFEDDNGHGTHVAGCVAAEKNGVGVVGVAPHADLYIAKAFNKDGYAPSAAIKKSIRWMMEQEVDVVNMSFSSKAAEADYQELMAQGYERGIVFICAAGNDGSSTNTDTIGYPARFEQSVAVTAVDIHKEATDFSSAGPGAEICAAGKDIYSTYLNNGYAKLSGTSMATPLITGAVAILQAKAIRRYGHRLSPDDIRLLLHMYAEDLGFYGRDQQYGYGLFTFGRLTCPDNVNCLDCEGLGEETKTKMPLPPQTAHLLPHAAHRPIPLPAKTAARFDPSLDRLLQIAVTAGLILRS